VRYWVIFEALGCRDSRKAYNKKQRDLLKPDPATAQCVDVHVDVFPAGVD